MRNRLLNLYRANGRKNAQIRADGNTIYLYDVIAGSESDAEWWGGVSAEGLARTLADLQALEAVGSAHVAEAIQFRRALAAVAEAA